MDILLALLVPAIPLGLVTLLLLMWNKEKP